MQTATGSTLGTRIIPTRTPWLFGGVIALALAIAVLARTDVRLLLPVVLVPALIVLLLARPQLAIAIAFNGTLLFFYAVYKLGFMPNQFMTGTFHAFLACSYILPLMFLLAKAGKHIEFTSVDALFGCLFFWLFFSYFSFATANDLATTKVIYAPLMVIAPYFAVRFFASETGVRRFFDYCVVIGVLLMGVAFHELASNQSLTQRLRFSICVFSERSINPILFGITFSVLLLIVFVRLFEGKRHALRYLLIAFPSGWLVLRSGSRGAMVSLCVSVVFYVLFLIRMRWLLRIPIILGIAVMFFIGLATLPESTRGFYQYSITPDASLDENSSIYTRLRFYRSALNDFRENPLIGVGTGNSVEGQGYPHNIVLELLAEHGILGFTLFFALCIVTIRKGFALVRRASSLESRHSGKLAMTLFVFALVEALFSNYLTRQTQLFVTIALIVSLSQRSCVHEAAFSVVHRRSTQPNRAHNIFACRSRTHE